MKTFSLFMDDVDPTLDAAIVKKIQASVRNVRINGGGYLVNRLALRAKALQLAQPTDDWRVVYARHLAHQFPHAWIYTGGRHLAVHASPPAPATKANDWKPGEAGRCLFRIIEVKRLEKLACGLHHGEVAGAPCRKCAAGIPQRNASQARDRALISALEPV